MAINLNDLAGALTGAQEQPAAPRASRDQYGTIALDALGTPTVMLDGGTDFAPCTCMVGVHHGDRVLAHVVNHKIVVFANITAPTTDDAQALVAIDRADAAAEAADAAGIAAASAQADATAAKADAATAKSAAQGAVADAADAKAAATQAQADAASAAQDASSAAASAQSAEEDAQAASTAATSAQGSAQTAQQAAQSAQSDAASAASAAQSAQDDATSAASSASAAASSASTAQAQASAATTAANEAKADAKTAKDNAAQAVSDAATAKQAATDATTTANGAVTALATVQGVVDQLETDVDELQVHVAMMDAYSDGHGGTVPAGLHVVPTGSGYFLVIANDGTYVYDAQSVLVTKFGESIDFSSTRPQRIGNDTAYIEYYDSDNDGHPDSIRIAGSNLDATIAQMSETVRYGGKNLLLDTGDMAGWHTTGSATIADGIATFPTVTTSTWREIAPAKNFKYELIRNRQVTFSAEVKADEGAQCAVNLCIGLDATETAYGRKKYRNQQVTFTGTGTWDKVSATADITDAWFNYSGSGTVDFDDCWVTVRPGAWGSVAYVAGFQLRHPKLEIGPIATPWDYASEDVTTLTNTVNSVKSTATANVAKISSLTATLGTNADGTSKAGDVMHRVSSAETAIEQNAEGITLNASRIETVGNPNLVPWFSSMPLSTDGNPHWLYVANLGTVTDMGDGWLRFQYENSTGSTKRALEMGCALSPSITPGGTYTWLVEMRNNASTVTGSGFIHAYLVQTTGNQFWGATSAKKLDDGSSSARDDMSFRLTADVNPESGRIQRTKVAESASSGHWGGAAEATNECARWNWDVASGVTVDAEFRVSLYEGEYAGPWKPYSGSQLYASQAELKVANGRITTLVEGLEQSSYFQQTEDGFTFAIDSAISTVAQAAGNAQDSADSAATAAAAAAQAAEDASRMARDYLTFQNGELTIGTSESDIRSVLTNVKFAFKTDAGDIAYFGLNNDGIWQMHIATAYMDDMLRFGDYAWIKRDNGNMSIKWLGA